ncbi:glycosyltransferase family 20-domain-containing protein [Cladochytrium replicatum]|nr:glycosyltransferase family 20-domain-containing protein [Cladochytrium replicatum]
MDWDNNSSSSSSRSAVAAASISANPHNQNSIIVASLYLPYLCHLAPSSKLPNQNLSNQKDYFSSNHYSSTSINNLQSPTNASVFARVASPKIPSTPPTSSTSPTPPTNSTTSSRVHSELNAHMMVPNGPAILSPIPQHIDFPSPIPKHPSSPPVPRSESISWLFPNRRGHSALFAGIRSLVPSSPTPRSIVQVGWTGTIASHDRPEAPIPTSAFSSDFVDSLKNQLWLEKACVPVIIDEKVAQAHYDGYCKNELWPLFHYVLWDSALQKSLDKRSTWEGYVKVNELFAQTIAKVYRPGDLIWINDYHLLLVPSLLRKLIPKASIGFFLHTPFPSSEIFRCLPRRVEILRGVLGANLVGFQTYSYARHFISSCTRVLGLESSPKGVDYQGTLVNVAIFPIGIDMKRVQTRRKLPGVRERASTIRDLYAGKKIIVGRDKLDHVKGVVHKLNAFEKFLELYPEFRNKVVLIQVTTPPKTPGSGSSKLESRVSDICARINGQYGSLEFAPVHHFHQHLNQDEYFALLNVADVGLITSLRDGMNTTSHEFVVCQQENCAPLILSEFTGTAGSLSAAMLVNPWDYTGVANAIYDALTMGKEERFSRHQQQYAHVSTHTAEFWAASFVKELRVCASLPSLLNTTPVLDEDATVRAYKTAERRLIMFDYDGTLTPIVRTPMAALPPPDMLRFLETLVADPKNTVYIISGRDQATLDLWLGHIPNLGLSAEHGSFIKYPGGKWINLTEDMDFSWKAEVAEIFNYYTERTTGSFVEHKRCSITWHYRLADPTYGLFQAKECRNHIENAVMSKLPIEIMIGKKNLEVRPLAVNKGEIVKRLALGGSGRWGFIMCAGDDRTDEDMFASLKSLAGIPTATGVHTNIASEEGLGVVDADRVFTVTLGSATKMTQAQWHVGEPWDLIEVMGKMANVSSPGIDQTVVRTTEEDVLAAAIAAAAMVKPGEEGAGLGLGGFCSSGGESPLSAGEEEEGEQQ